MINPLVSIVMSVYNAEKTLKLAMDSVINQTYSNWELLITDDGSIDDSKNILSSYSDPRIKTYSDGLNKGLSKRLNQLVDASKGEYIARMDADDVSYPERIFKQVEFLEKNKEIDVLASKIIVFDDEYNCVGTFPYRQDHDSICKKPENGFYFPHPTWMGKTSWFLKYKYNESSFMSEDQELLLRAHRESKYHCLDDVLLGYRIDNIGIKKEFKTRMSRVLDYSRYYVLNHEYLTVQKIVLIQALKFLYSAFSICTPFTFRLLKNRALPVEQEICNEWKVVCQNLSVRIEE